MAPDTSMQPFVSVSAASMSLPIIPRSPRALRDVTLDEELNDSNAKLILSDFTQSTPQGLSIHSLLVTEHFPMDLYRSMFFINTLDHEYKSVYDMCLSLTLQER